MWKVFTFYLRKCNCGEFIGSLVVNCIVSYFDFRLGSRDNFLINSVVGFLRWYTQVTLANTNIG